jgi:ABC-type transporter Mla MlaB component
MDYLRISRDNHLNLQQSYFFFGGNLRKETLPQALKKMEEFNEEMKCTKPLWHL